MRRWWIFEVNVQTPWIPAFAGMTSKARPYHVIPALTTSFPLLPRHSREGGNPIFIFLTMAQYSYVYLLTNKLYGTLYLGVTSNLPKRIWEHKSKFVDGFSKKYDLHRLVWYEQHESIEAAIFREKQIKKWNRAWKIRMIQEMNPDWKDLYLDFTA